MAGEAGEAALFEVGAGAALKPGGVGAGAEHRSGRRHVDAAGMRHDSSSSRPHGGGSRGEFPTEEVEALTWLRHPCVAARCGTLVAPASSTLLFPRQIESSSEAVGDRIELGTSLLSGAAQQADLQEQGGRLAVVTGSGLSLSLHVRRQCWSGGEALPSARSRWRPRMVGLPPPGGCPPSTPNLKDTGGCRSFAGCRKPLQPALL